MAADPHKWATVAQSQKAVVSLQDMVVNRPVYLQSFVGCEQGNPADTTDADGDGVPWCNDCDDNNAVVHPGAPEICGNHIDDNCNGLIDENCPATDGGTTDASADGGTADGGRDGGAPDAGSDGGPVDGGTRG